MDNYPRTLLLQKEKKKRSASVFSALIFITALIVGVGLIVIGVNDYRSNQASDVRASNQEEPVSTPQVQGVSTCQSFLQDGTSAFISAYASRDWVLIGNEFTEEEKSFVFNAELDPVIETFLDTSEIEVLYRVVGTNITGEMTSSPDNSLQYTANVSSNSLNVGVNKIEAVVDSSCGTSISVADTFNVSYPVYVTWTMDWESYNVSQEKIDAMENVSKRHDNIPMTHFFNPRLLIPGVVPQADRDRMVNYVKQARDYRGHAIGLHIHAFPDLMKAAGVTPHEDPRWGWYRNDGYDILVSGYSYEDTMKVLNWSDDIFRQYGLGSPNMFRAGGWFADETTLKALEDSNYLLDSSGRQRYKLGTNNTAGHWELYSTTQPYRPNYSDQNSSSGSPSEIMRLWEFPNNGADSTAFTAEKMYSYFKDNYNGTPVQEHKVVTYLSHPDYFDIDQPRMDELLGNIDRHLYKQDKGPVIYTTLEDTYNIYIGIK